MNSTIVIVNEKYQIVLPKAVRKSLSIQPKDKIIFSIGAEGEIILKKIPSLLDLQGSYRFPREYLMKERASW